MNRIILRFAGRAYSAARHAKHDEGPSMYEMEGPCRAKRASAPMTRRPVLRSASHRIPVTHPRRPVSRPPVAFPGSPRGSARLRW